MKVTEGRCIRPEGFRASGVACGLKPEGRDLALIASDRPAAAAGVFTTNRVQAAPIQLNREHLADRTAQAIVINSRNANACTGDRGLADARQTAREVARKLGFAPENVLVNSTGVIGVPLPMDRIRSGIPVAVSELREDGWADASAAIMTTDTVPKMASVRIRADGRFVTVCGIAKGAGMIAPDMATMLGFIATDAGIEPVQLETCLRKAVDRSFNCITVDGDTSTNDTVLLLANGAAGERPLSRGEVTAFQTGLNAVCVSLARQIARDGEGATKLITIRVDGASSTADARTVGLSVGNSKLVKTAVFGRDPNWGRILCAIGYAGVPVDPDEISVSMAGIPIYRLGRGLPFDTDEAIQALSANEIDIDIDLGPGNRSATIYSCDLTYDYVRINAEYTT
ncbi:MAG: bifunctional glutamate N-acetyltransferase/amino-acid acetyltransferase ArgJ [Gemmatimonadota bacterium]|nr:bifunctional glutamate N-acetyltransferase/amino-acid acetyltransferase ArgJ [Gemmatimonadota bacterium]